jgi:hypothetical protein
MDSIGHSELGTVLGWRSAGVNARTVPLKFLAPSSNSHGCTASGMSRTFDETISVRSRHFQDHHFVWQEDSSSLAIPFSEHSSSANAAQIPSRLPRMLLTLRHGQQVRGNSHVAQFVDEESQFQAPSPASKR